MKCLLDAIHIAVTVMFFGILLTPAPASGQTTPPPPGAPPDVTIVATKIYYPLGVPEGNDAHKLRAYGTIQGAAGKDYLIMVCVREVNAGIPAEEWKIIQWGVKTTGGTGKATYDLLGPLPMPADKWQWYVAAARVDVAGNSTEVGEFNKE